jgi:hypothetical protein
MAAASLDISRREIRVDGGCDPSRPSCLPPGMSASRGEAAAGVCAAAAKPRTPVTVRDILRACMRMMGHMGSRKIIGGESLEDFDRTISDRKSLVPSNKAATGLRSRTRHARRGNRAESPSINHRLSAPRHAQYSPKIREHRAFEQRCSIRRAEELLCTSNANAHLADRLLERLERSAHGSKAVVAHLPLGGVDRSLDQSSRPRLRRRAGGTDGPHRAARYRRRCRDRASCRGWIAPRPSFRSTRRAPSSRRPAWRSGPRNLARSLPVRSARKPVLARLLEKPLVAPKRN